MRCRATSVAKKIIIQARAAATRACFGWVQHWLGQRTSWQWENCPGNWSSSFSWLMTVCKYIVFLWRPCQYIEIPQPEYQVHPHYQRFNSAHKLVWRSDLNFLDEPDILDNPVDIFSIVSLRNSNNLQATLSRALMTKRCCGALRSWKHSLTPSLEKLPVKRTEWGRNHHAMIMMTSMIMIMQIIMIVAIVIIMIRWPLWLGLRCWWLWCSRADV